MMEDAARQTN